MVRRAGPQLLADSISPLASSTGETSFHVLLGERGVQMGPRKETPQTEESTRKASCTLWNQQKETDGAAPPQAITSEIF